jgi:hypothetical protein
MTEGVLELPMNILFRSAAVGMLASIAIGVLAFVLAPIFDAVGIYIRPAGHACAPL